VPHIVFEGRRRDAPPEQGNGLDRGIPNRDVEDPSTSPGSEATFRKQQGNHEERGEEITFSLMSR